MKIKSRKIIRGYRPKFSVQKKIADTIEKIANKLAKILKRSMPLKL